MVAAPRPRKDEINGQSYESTVITPDHSQDVGDPLNIGPSRHRGIQFARFQGATAIAIEDGAKLPLLEELLEACFVFEITANEARPVQRPIVGSSQPNDLPREKGVEIVEGVVARDSCNSGHE